MKDAKPSCKCGPGFTGAHCHFTGEISLLSLYSDITSYLVFTLFLHLIFVRLQFQENILQRPALQHKPGTRQRPAHQLNLVTRQQPAQQHQTVTRQRAAHLHQTVTRQCQAHLHLKKLFLLFFLSVIFIVISCPFVLVFARF